MDPNTYYDDNAPIEHRFSVNGKVAGVRLDRYVTQHVPGYSRNVVQRLIRDGQVRVNGKPAKGSYMVEIDDVIEVEVPTIRKVEMVAQDIKFDVIYEDEDILAVNKPPGLIIHPGTGRVDGTLANGIMYYFNLQSGDAIHGDRVGIVHRIDKDTTGVLLVAKSTPMHAHLQHQFAGRTVEKQYLCFAQGAPEFDEGKVDLPIGHDRRVHTIRTIRPESEGGKPSLTFYKVLERFDGSAIVQCRPKTGRTHQIRVHMKALGHPLLIDETYGNNSAVYLSDLTGRPRGENEAPVMDRLTLHAHRIRFVHPRTEQWMELEAPIPDDMRRLAEALRKHKPAKIGRSKV